MNLDKFTNIPYNQMNCLDLINRFFGLNISLNITTRQELLTFLNSYPQIVWDYLPVYEPSIVILNNSTNEIGLAIKQEDSLLLTVPLYKSFIISYKSSMINPVLFVNPESLEIYFSANH